MAGVEVPEARRVAYSIVLGQAVPIPMRIKFTALSDTAMPRSKSARFSSAWRQEGMSQEQIHELTHIDPWFLDQLVEIVEMEDRLRAVPDLASVDTPTLREAKRFGFSDVWVHKACKRNDIPTPGVGYWAKLEAGKTLIRVPLPPRGHGHEQPGEAVADQVPRSS